MTEVCLHVFDDPKLTNSGRQLHGAGRSNVDLCVCVCVRNLAGRVGLPISVEVVSEPLGERYQHDLYGQTEGSGARRR